MPRSASQVGGLEEGFELHAGQFGREGLDEPVAVAAQLYRLAPRLAIAVGGLARGEAEGGDLRHDAGRRADEFRAQAVVE